MLRSLLAAVRRYPAAFVGLLLLAGSLLSGYILLVGKAEPSGGPTPEIGFAASKPPGQPSLSVIGEDPGFKWMRASSLRASVLIQPPLWGSCNPVSVLLQIEGISHVKRHSLPIASGEKFTYVLAVRGPGPPVRRVRLLSPGAQGSTVPRVPRVAHTPGRHGDQLRPISPVNTTYITGGLRDERSNPQLLTFTFLADWSERRSAGACFVRLPRLISNDLGSLAQGRVADITGGPLDAGVGSLVPTRGSVQVDVNEGTLGRSADDMAQPPSDPSLPAWECTVSRPRSYGIPKDNRDCGGWVVARRASLEEQRLFVLFIAAALVSLSLQVLYDAVRGRNRVR
jgi:hypothetical protein